MNFIIKLITLILLLNNITCNTPIIDGIVGSDWNTMDMYETSSGGITRNCITWDSDYLYIGSIHEDVNKDDPDGNNWVIVYIGNGEYGSNEGFGHGVNEQKPTIGFNATYAIRWQSDNAYNSRMVYDNVGKDWLAGEDGYLRSDAPVANQTYLAFDDGNNGVEFRLPLVDMDLTNEFQIHIHWQYEDSRELYDGSYAGSPSDYIEVHDPNITSWFTFYLTGEPQDVSSTGIFDDFSSSSGEIVDDFSSGEEFDESSSGGFDDFSSGEVDDFSSGEEFDDFSSGEVDDFSSGEEFDFSSGEVDDFSSGGKSDDFSSGEEAKASTAELYPKINVTTSGIVNIYTSTIIYVGILCKLLL